MSRLANRLGFDEIGNFQQTRYARTIFLDRSQVIAIEVGVDGGTYCFKILSATGDGKPLITSAKEPELVGQRHFGERQGASRR